jgi:hypothetical protein
MLITVLEKDEILQIDYSSVSEFDFKGYIEITGF